MGRALEGIVILDLGQIYHGPYCSLLLAFMGAKVIKIEPIEGESIRTRVRPGVEAHELIMLNSNKRGIALNLKTQEGKNIFLELVEQADVVLENFNTGVMERLGLGFDQLSKLNPRLIYASGKGYGLSGPYANYPAMDLTIQAMSGAMASTGFPEQPPVKAGPAFSDFLGAVHLYGGIVTALFQRERTNHGQFVEVSMHDAIYPTLASPLGGYFDRSKDIPERTGNRHSGLAVAPYNMYPTNDGYITIICIAERHYEGLVRFMERLDLLHDERFATPVLRAKNMDALDKIISEWTNKWNKWDLVKELFKIPVPCAPVLSVKEVAEDPHLKFRGMIREIDHPTKGRVLVPGSPIRLSESPLEEVQPAPLLGQHTQEILKDILGYNEEQINQLKEKKIVK